jgi:hypothetical protein
MKPSKPRSKPISKVVIKAELCLKGVNMCLLSSLGRIVNAHCTLPLVWAIVDDVILNLYLKKNEQ